MVQQIKIPKQPKPRKIIISTEFVVDVIDIYHSARNPEYIQSIVKE
jgi:hypothetical protein